MPDFIDLLRFDLKENHNDTTEGNSLHNDTVSCEQSDDRINIIIALESSKNNVFVYTDLMSAIRNRIELLPRASSAAFLIKLFT